MMKFTHVLKIALFAATVLSVTPVHADMMNVDLFGNTIAYDQLVKKADRDACRTSDQKRSKLRIAEPQVIRLSYKCGLRYIDPIRGSSVGEMYATKEACERAKIVRENEGMLNVSTTIRSKTQKVSFKKARKESKDLEIDPRQECAQLLKSNFDEFLKNNDNAQFLKEISSGQVEFIVYDLVKKNASDERFIHPSVKIDNKIHIYAVYDQGCYLTSPSDVLKYFNASAQIYRGILSQGCAKTQATVFEETPSTNSITISPVQ